MSGLAERIRARDPEGDGARRAARAAIFIPLAAAVGFAVGDGTQTPVFAILGAITLLIAADFPGTTATRALGYAGLAVNGTVLITVATLVAPHPWVAVPLCFAVGAAVSFLGLLNEVVAAGQRATLITFVLPVCLQPVGPLGDRLFGWVIALVICVPAALLVFPPRYTSQLRRQAAAVCAALAGRIDGATTDTELSTAMDTLRSGFLGNAVRPATMTAGSRALIRVIPNLGWLCRRVGPDPAALLGPLAASAARVLRAAADVLDAPGPASRSELDDALAAHRTAVIGHYSEGITEVIDAPDDAAAVRLGDALLQGRIISATIGLVGRIIAAGAATDARPWWVRLFGNHLPDTGIADRVYTNRAAVTALGGYVSTRSLTVLNSVRTGMSLALALVVSLVLPVQNAPWVALGALSVLRSSALMTRTSAVRAVTGTVIGFVVGAAVIWLLGVDPPVLWALLPLTAFGSTYISVVGSFTASQAMFTMLVVIVFNLILPTGWQIGLVRVEDVVVGALVGMLVSVLLWPGGAASALRRAINGAMAINARYLSATVERVIRGASGRTDDAVAELHRDTVVAARTYNDAFRNYVAESGGVVDPAVLQASGLMIRVRTTADLIADLVPPPASGYPLTRAVLQSHTTALCGRLDGSDPGGPAGSMAADFVPALRAEAGGDFPAAEALPLVTVAANVAELEQAYPVEAEADSSAQHA